MAEDRDDLIDQLWRSLKRPVRCLVCDITFISPRDGLSHLRAHSREQHPATRAQR